ncbi:MAG: hypothetical protein AB1521_07645 [Bacteroidota bacterium]
MPAKEDFPLIFEHLKKIMKKYEKKLKVQADTKDNYCLIGPFSERFKKELWFGAVQIKKNYVSYHLMPVYMYREIALGVPVDLKKRMQGKSCFNFNKFDKGLFKELAEFTDASFKLFVKRGDDITLTYKN